MAKSAKLKSVPKVVPVYDPKKSYSWKGDDILGITGFQVDIINKALQLKLQSPEVQQALYIIEAAKAVQEVIKSGVEEGIIFENPEQAAEETAK